MRLRYQRRREALLQALARWLPQGRPSGADAGLFELVELPAGVNEPALLAAAAARGVGMEGLAWHRFTHGGRSGRCCSAMATCPSRRSSRAFA